MALGLTTQPAAISRSLQLSDDGSPGGDQMPTFRAGTQIIPVSISRSPSRYREACDRATRWLR